MTRENKAQLVDGLTKKLQEVDHFYITDASGLTVAEINKFRRRCFTRGVEYRVVKNTLIRKSLENLDGDFSALNDALRGFSGLMFVNENAKIPAKIIKDYKRENSKDRPKFKAACIASDLFIGEDQLDVLASLKSKQELVGEIITLLQSPTRNILTLLQSGKHKLAGIVKILSEEEK